MIKSECAVCHRSARWPGKYSDFVILSFAFFCYLTRFAGGILIPRAMLYGLCMEHLDWLPQFTSIGNEFIRYIEIDVTNVGIYTPVRIHRLRLKIYIPINSPTYIRTRI
jgi:hypothetical protein